MTRQTLADTRADIVRLVLLALLLAAAPPTPGLPEHVDFYRADGSRAGSATVDPTGRYLDLYSPSGQRLGTGRIGADGYLDVYAPDGSRLGTGRVRPPTGRGGRR